MLHIVNCLPGAILHVFLCALPRSYRIFYGLWCTPLRGPLSEDVRAQGHQLKMLTLGSLFIDKKREVNKLSHWWIIIRITTFKLDLVSQCVLHRFTYVTSSNKTRNKSHGTILRYRDRSLKVQVQKYCQKVKFEMLVFL